MIQLENRLYRPREIMSLMAIDNRVQFWNVVKRVKPTPTQQTGPRHIRFYPEAVRMLLDFYKVEGPKDLKRIADGRTKATRTGS